MTINSKLLKISSLILIFLIIFSVVEVKAVDRKTLEGEWEGKIKLGEKELLIIVNFIENDNELNATIDIPMQTVFNYQLQKLEYNNSNISFELPAQEIGKFTAKISDYVIKGDYEQGDSKGTFYLIKEGKNKKISFDKGDIFKEGEKEEEKYNDKFIIENDVVEEKKLESNKEVLSRPKGLPPYPAIIIFSDFGKINKKRDYMHSLFENLYKNKGFAVLRYENNSFDFNKNIKGEELSYQQLVEDSANYIQKIKNNSLYNSIHILGINQGALLSLAAVQNDKTNVESFVLLNPPFRSASKIILEEFSGLQNNLLAETKYIIEKLEKGEKVQEVSKELKPFFNVEIQPFLISWFKYDPVELMEKSKIPILILENNEEKISDLSIENKNVEYEIVEYIYNNEVTKKDLEEELELNKKIEKKIKNFIEKK